LNLLLHLKTEPLQLQKIEQHQRTAEEELQSHPAKVPQFEEA